MLSCFSCVRLFAILWTAVCQTSLSMNSPGRNTGVVCHAFLQGIFPTQESNACFLCLLHWWVGSLPLAQRGSLSSSIRDTGVVHALCAVLPEHLAGQPSDLTFWQTVINHCIHSQPHLQGFHLQNQCLMGNQPFYSLSKLLKKCARTPSLLTQYFMFGLIYFFF